MIRCYYAIDMMLFDMRCHAFMPARHQRCIFAVPLIIFRCQLFYTLFRHAT